MGAYRNLAAGAAALGSLALAGQATALEIKSSDVHGPDYPTVEAIAYMGEKLSD